MYLPTSTCVYSVFTVPGWRCRVDMGVRLDARQRGTNQNVRNFVVTTYIGCNADRKAFERKISSSIIWSCKNVRCRMRKYYYLIVFRAPISTIHCSEWTRSIIMGTWTTRFRSFTTIEKKYIIHNVSYVYMFSQNSYCQSIRIRK